MQLPEFYVEIYPVWSEEDKKLEVDLLYYTDEEETEPIFSDSFEFSLNDLIPPVERLNIGELARLRNRLEYRMEYLEHEWFRLSMLRDTVLAFPEKRWSKREVIRILGEELPEQE